MKRAGIDPEGRHLVPHSSRNSLAAQLEDQGVSLRYIGDLLGYSSIKTTKIYLPEAARAIRNLGRKISEARAAVEQEKAAQQNVVDFKVS